MSFKLGVVDLKTLTQTKFTRVTTLDGRVLSLKILKEKSLMQHTPDPHYNNEWEEEIRMFVIEEGKPDVIYFSLITLGGEAEDDLQYSHHSYEFNINNNYIVNDDGKGIWKDAKFSFPDGEEQEHTSDGCEEYSIETVLKFKNSPTVEVDVEDWNGREETKLITDFYKLRLKEGNFYIYMHAWGANITLL
jgi:hypothetical protein